MPLFLPWLAILGLLMLTPNRSGNAWWIWLPLGGVFAVELLMPMALGSIPSQVLDLFSQVARSLGIGMAAVWLTSPYLAGHARFVNFLKMLGVQGAFSLLALAPGLDWGDAGFEILGALVYLGVLILVLVAGLNLAGFSCRRRFHPVRLLLWLLVWLTAGITTVILPFATVALFGGAGEIWMQVGTVILVAVGVAFVLLLPFLVLSFANNFYRERLRHLLRMESAEVPPVLTFPPPPPVTA